MLNFHQNIQIKTSNSLKIIFKIFLKIYKANNASIKDLYKYRSQKFSLKSTLHFNILVTFINNFKYFQ